MKTYTVQPSNSLSVESHLIIALIIFGIGLAGVIVSLTTDWDDQIVTFAVAVVFGLAWALGSGIVLLKKRSKK